MVCDTSSSKSTSRRGDTAKKERVMRNFIIAAFAAIVLLVGGGLFLSADSPLGPTTAAAGKPCQKDWVYVASLNDCVYRAPKQDDFVGGTARPKTIKVQVCISWYDRLNSNGGRAWWGLRLTSWPGKQYKPVYDSCKWQNVPVGYRVYNDPNCFPGWRYATDPVTVAGATYHLKRWHRI